jgi:hypothetical protein
MQADPRISEIDAIVRVRPVEGHPLPGEPERYSIMACLTGFRKPEFYVSSVVMDLPRGSSTHAIREQARLEIAEELDCDPERIFVIMIPEDSRYE